MKAGNGIVELGFVTARDVKRYVKHVLTDEECADVEQTLLDDERARQLVVENTDPDNAPPPSQVLVKTLVSAVEACQQSLGGYALMNASDGSAQLQVFAEPCLAARWALLEQILHMINDDYVSDAANRFHDNTGEPIEISAADLEKALKQDYALISCLREAFDAASTPIWKAKIAAWMAKIDDDIFRLERISSDNG